MQEKGWENSEGFINADVIFLAGDTFMIPLEDAMNSSSESICILNLRTGTSLGVH